MRSALFSLLLKVSGNFVVLLNGKAGCHNGQVRVLPPEDWTRRSTESFDSVALMSLEAV